MRMTQAKNAFGAGDYKTCIDINRKVAMLAKDMEVDVAKVAAAHLNAAYTLNLLCEYDEARQEYSE